jgi:dihydrofolate reductase
MLINGIVAISRNRGIGVENKIPWNLPSDLKRFRKFTTGNGNNSIIMGKNTWDSIKFLKNRDHLILSRSTSLNYTTGGNLVKTFESIETVLKHCEERKYDEIWVIGGSQIYNLFIESGNMDYIYMTYIDDDYTCDTFFEQLPNTFFLIQKTQYMHEVTELGKNTYLLVYKQAKPGMKVTYANNIWTIETIHYDDFPNLYFTIKNNNGQEKQTIKDRLNLI